MFRAVPMTRISAVILARDERAVLKGLGRLGAVQLVHNHPEGDALPLAITDPAGEMERYEGIRARLQELHQSLELPAFSGGPLRAEMTLEQAEEDLRDMEERSSDLLNLRRGVAQQLKDLAALREQLSSYYGSDVPLDDPGKFSFLHFVTGRMPERNLGNLGRDIGDNAAVIPLSRQGGWQSLMAVTTLRGRPELEKVLREAEFQHEALPVVEGKTVDGLYEEGQKEQQQLTAQMEELNGRLGELAAEFVPVLGRIGAFVDTEHRLLEAGRTFPRTGAAVLIEGWVPAEDAEAVERRMGEITGGSYVLETAHPDVSAQQQVPVLLRHSRLLRPFEMLVSTYGLPDYRELEPTLFVAISYVLMFGLMFGDAGHGLVLALCGLAALFAGKSQKVRDFGILLIFAGMSSIIFGMVYGSYFGIEAFKKYAIWHDPLEGDPMRLMYGTVGIGVVMISVGIIFNVVNRFLKGDMIGGILDKFGLAGLLFYWGTLAIMIGAEAIRSRGLMTVCFIVFFVAPVACWAFRGPISFFMHREEHESSGANIGPIGAILESFVEAFEAVLSYLANTISFVRLAAYAMSHAALLFASFMLAELVRQIPFGGGVWAVLVIIIGNLVAIVLEGIIASVQALRLEYYEFFGKFFSGSGQPFEPFCLAADDEGPAS